MKTILTIFFVLTLSISSLAQEEPLKLGIAGLTHGHVGWILGREHQSDINMVGIYEENTELAKRFSEQYGFSMDIVFSSMEEMLQATKPDAVAAFGNIKDHLSVVQWCAPKGIHVMVEKPLAVSLEHALEMEKLAKENNIHLLTNYETSWYPTNEEAKNLLNKGTIGSLRKAIIRDGHKGPKKIGVSSEFFEWLTDPELNGGGAIMDFGCYGANLMTWLLKGERPKTVTAVTQQLQPQNNPEVDDDATIILKYDSSMAILEPSWNWPIGRKDMELYGETGAIYAENKTNMSIRISEGYDGFSEEKIILSDRANPFDDPFSVFASVINGELRLEPFDPYSLENNMITMEILQAALESSKTNKTFILK
ncbi:Gfo/Idh/MocA family protein [Maribacter sp. 4G9]|uniref:Gfo/Idh/MocA family protein n=1 Tax=Maribacter sp. 4G9 TaxID=1889777 RepID=UPI000C14512D|nr:Gfo/Idh/MocA family oxidoreductase [Maribacter sp. 4G9]PIB25299.1 oxidoreductase [Maribacter sp. 4G9]